MEIDLPIKSASVENFPFSPPAGDYVILGRVTAKTRFMQSGYALLREQAAARYPDADDVIHVQVDGKRNILLYILLRTYTYELSGLAIKYVDSVKASDNSMLKDDRDSFESHSSE